MSYPEVAGKQLELLKAAVPKLSRVAVLFDSAEEGPPSAHRNTERTNALHAAGRTLGVQPQTGSPSGRRCYDARTT